MWLTFATGALAGGPPVVRVEWRRDHAKVRVEAPAEEKVAADARARLFLGWSAGEVDLVSDGAILTRGVDLADLRGITVDGSLEVVLCDLSGTICRPTSWHVSGDVPDGKRGWVTLTVAAPESLAEPFGPDATADAAEAAFARAKGNGKAVMLDFSAVWCPPCNLLAAEVLHGPPAGELEGYEVAILDVDHASSFALKDKYTIGGYPTVVVVDAEGNEKARTVGYAGREPFLAWLAGAAGSNEGADLARPVEELSGERAAELAWNQVQAANEARATALLTRAEAAGADTVAYHLARLSIRGEAADLDWLLAKAPERATDFVSAAVGAKDALPPEQVRRAAELALRQARGTAVADALSAAAELEDDEATVRVLNAAAVAVVRSAMTGDPAHDKGYVTWLAHLLEASGDPDGAVALLVDSVETWPEEPTFDLALAPLLKELGRLEEALASADRAVALAWGDNHLRAVTTKAQVLVAMGKTDEAKALVDAELAAQPAPEAGLEVRTHRYRTRLAAVVEPGTD